MLKGWKKIPGAAEYFGVSVRTMRTLINEGFPHSTLPSGTKLVNLEDGDAYLRQFGNEQKNQEIIDKLLKGITP